MTAPADTPTSQDSYSNPVAGTDSGDRVTGGATVTTEEIIARIDQLPRLPGPALRLIEVLNDPDASISDIVDTIRFDQAITARVLRLCNSASFGLARKVASIDDAIKLVGTAKVLELVMAAHSESFFSGAQEGYGLGRHDLWQHSIGVAIGAQRFGQDLQLPATSALFTAGLMHDVGKLVLDQYVQRETDRLQGIAYDGGATFFEAERQIFGIDRAELSARIVESWDFPEAIAHAIRHHAAPHLLDPSDPLVDCLYLADVTCVLMGIGVGNDGLLQHAHDEVLGRHGLTGKALQVVGAEIVVEVKSVQSLFAASEGESCTADSDGATPASEDQPEGDSGQAS